MGNNLTVDQMPNIGDSLAKLLEQAGIHTSDELISLGALQAFIRIRAIDPDACFSKLCALEGATEGIRWHYLSSDKKKELNEWFRQLQR